jgi:hypothetical protein
MNSRIVKRVLATLSLAACSWASQAGYLGNTVQATAYYPELPPGATTIAGPVQAVVGAGVEFTDGQFTPFFGPSFDLSDTTILITHAATGHSSGTFNGYAFFDVLSAIDDIVGVDILSDNSGFFSGNPSRVFFDANNVFVNFESLSFIGVANPQIVLGVRFANNQVPEPETLLLVGLGLLAIAGARRKSRQLV